MNEKLQEFMNYQARISAYYFAFSLIGYDEATVAPKGANALTAKLEGILSGEYYRLATDPHLKELIFELDGDPSLSDAEKEILRKAKKDILLTEAVPEAEYTAYRELTSRSQRVWEEAKEANDFSAFSPVLSEVVEATKKIAAYQNFEHRPLYDVLLDQFEEGFLSETLDGFFTLLRKEIVPLLKRAEAGNSKIRTDFLRRYYDIEKQKEFNRFLAEYVGYDLNRGLIMESVHPFTDGLHMDNVRITTAYDEHAPESAIFSTIHESGHAIFEQGKDRAFELVPLSISMGLHESQSRMYENMIGRSEAFWKPIYPRLQALFPENLSDVTLSEWIRAINRAEASLIRTESDELTYCLHIMVRYEAEKKLFNEGVPAEDLPKLWNALYKEYLGIEPPDDRQGVLQDVHWSQGALGYFPSYAIGNAVAAQLYHAMDKEIGVEALLSNGEPLKIRDWLHDHVHVYGGLKPVQAILKDVTGEAFDPKYYVEYLKEKFTKLYA